MTEKIIPNTLIETHRFANIGWLRASVLGANDGIVSTASLIVGVASANSAHHEILITGLAGLVAGALSMAAGEYVSVSSQADTEQADLARERIELSTHLESERKELAEIYVKRGLDQKLAEQVAKQLMDHDALGSHARDELGITDLQSARPLQAAFASATTFAIGSALPLSIVWFNPTQNLILTVCIASLFFLVALGVLAARAGGANPLKGALRVGFWGAFAMGVTAGIGHLFGKVV